MTVGVDVCWANEVIFTLIGPNGHVTDDVIAYPRYNAACITLRGGLRPPEEGQGLVVTLEANPNDTTKIRIVIILMIML